jgi:hypothetical protein
VAWKGSSATAWVETLKSGGCTVLLEDTTGERAWRTAKERGIDAVIIDGQKKPSHGRQTGHALRDTAKTRNIPIIWTNLDTEDAVSVAAEVKPDVTLAAPTDATSALAALQSLAGGAVHFSHDDDEHDLEPVSTTIIATPRPAEPVPAVATAPAETPAPKSAKPPVKSAAKPAKAPAKPAKKTPAKGVKKPSASKAAKGAAKSSAKGAKTAPKKPARAARTAKP